MVSPPSSIPIPAKLTLMETRHPPSNINNHPEESHPIVEIPDIPRSTDFSLETSETNDHNNANNDNTNQLYFYYRMIRIAPPSWSLNYEG